VVILNCLASFLSTAIFKSCTSLWKPRHRGQKDVFVKHWNINMFTSVSNVEGEELILYML